jgi:acetyl-CoA carboxylase biotin carboxylase subunit
MGLFRKILVANRGEIAVRVIRACKELGIKTVAVYSTIERESIHVKLADEAVCIGPADSRQSYLNIPALLTVADLLDAEAVHPGYGFLAENAHFAETCISSGIVFIGPTPENIRLGGDKSQARRLMKNRGIPVVSGSDGVVQSEEAAVGMAAKIGYPVIFKASHGGGGRGMKIVTEESTLKHAFNVAQREALTAFGSKDLYMEKYIEGLRHMEVQIMADSRGSVVHLGERDCSIQRRHQKLIEESPSPSATARMRKRLGELAVKVAKAVNYRNLGTVEFAVDMEDNINFMEVNTRIQVEHPVTEAVTGIDLIKEQIRLAAGLPLGFKQSDIKCVGHAIECRINAEDPDKFIPSPGPITFFYPPGGPGVRVDTVAYAGWVVPSQYDSLFAKLIVHGRDREEAVKRMKRALGEFKVEGIKTSISFHERVLRNEDFISGRFNTNFVDSLNNEREK